MKGAIIPYFSLFGMTTATGWNFIYFVSHLIASLFENYLKKDLHQSQDHMPVTEKEKTLFPVGLDEIVMLIFLQFLFQ